MSENPQFADESQHWDRLHFIYYQYCKNLVKNRKSLTDQEKKELDERIRREVQFLVRNACDPDFHRYVNKRLGYTREKGRIPGKVALKHMRELTFFVFLDSLLKDKKRFATVGSNLKKSYTLPWLNGTKSPDGEPVKYSYDRLLELINKEYPELFTSRIDLNKRLGRRKVDSGGRKIHSRRERIIETVFTQVQRQSVPFEYLVLAAFGKDATPQFMRRMVFQMNEGIKLSLCDAEDLGKLIIFRKDVFNLIKLLQWNPFTPDHMPQSQDEVSMVPVLNSPIQILFLQLRTLVELRWFRSKSVAQQNKLIWKEPKIVQFSRKDAIEAVKRSREWFQSDSIVFQAVTVAMEPLLHSFKQPEWKFCTMLLSECLTKLSLDEGNRAACLHNLAFAYRAANKPRLMMKYLKQELAVLAKLGDRPGDMADALGFMAEYYKSLGDARKYLENRTKAEKLVRTGRLSVRRKAYHYLALADCAYMHGDRDWEQVLLKEGLLFSSKHKSIQDDYFSFFYQCLEENKLGLDRGPEFGPGRVPHPFDLELKQHSSGFGGFLFKSDNSY